MTKVESLMMLFLLILVLSFALLSLFFLISSKEKWESTSSTIFECGFTSYFFSRFSFSIHYFMIGLIFLFLDLELCFILPFFMEELSNLKTFQNLNLFMSVLLLGLIFEWGDGKIDWKF